MLEYKCIVLGVSAGGMEAISTFLRYLKKEVTMPIVIVQHLFAQQDDFLVKHLGGQTHFQVKFAQEKELIQQGYIYIAPPNYHLMIELDKTFSLTIDKKVHYSRPSIDVLFESAAEAYSDGLIGIVLTGANADGANGLKTIKEHGGMTIVQDPRTAAYPFMPSAAIESCNDSGQKVDYIIEINKISAFLNNL